MKKRIISALISVTLFCAALPVCSADKSGSDADDTAYAVMGEDLKIKNFEIFKVGAQSDNKLISERDGEECWIIDKANGLASDKLCMVLTDTFKAGVDDGDAYVVEVDYFDVAAGGFFFLAYDGQRPRQTNEFYQQAGETVYTEGTEKWKTAKFRIDDARFRKSLEGGCDIFVGTRKSDALNNADYLSDIPIPFKEVRITRLPKVNPVRNVVSIDNVGNAYSWFDEDKIIHNQFTSLRDEPAEYDITFSLEDGDGYIAYSKAEKVSFEADEVKDIDFSFGELKRCGRYNYYVTVENKELGVYSKVQYSVIAVIKTDPDGVKNEQMNFCGPGYSAQSITSEENFNKALELMVMGNFAGARFDEGWHLRETTPGNFITNTKTDTFADRVLEHNMDILPIMYMGNNVVTGGWNYMPDTEEELEKAENYMYRIVDRLKDKTEQYETWNEPDLPSFLRNFSAENYYNVYKRFYDVVQKLDSKAKIGFLCYAGAASEDRHDYTVKMLDMGLAQMIKDNAITFHGYPNPNAESFRTTEKIEWYIDKLKEYGISRDDYEIWITEYGGSVADPHIATRKRQGAVTLRETLMQRINLDVDKFYVYRFEDPGNLTYRHEASFGHVSSSNGYARVWGQICVPWESFIMLTGYNYLFANSEPAGIIADDSNLKAYRFKSNKFGGDIISINAVTGAEQITLDLGVNEISYFDEYANESKLASEDGVYTFTATEYPHYIMGSFDRARVLKDDNKFDVNVDLKSVADDTAKLIISNNTGKTLEAEWEMPGKNSYEQNVTLIPGMNEVSFENNISVGREYEIRLNIKDGNSLMSVLPISVTSVPVAVTQMSLQLKSPQNFNKWQAVAMVENTSDFRVINAEFELLSPEKLKVKPVNVSYIPARKKARVIFDLPEITQKRIYTFEYKLTLETGEVFEGSAKADTTCAAYAEKKPVIDGRIDDGEWNLQTLMQTSTIDNVVYSTNWQGKLWQGASDQSAKAYAMWDENNVYLCWDVTDDIFSQDYEEFYIWQGDSVQFGIYMGNNDEYVALGEANTAFTEIGIALTKTGPQLYRFSAQDSAKHRTGSLSEDEYDLGISVNGTRAIYELEIPWDNLLPDGLEPKANGRLGFSFLVNDNDGQGRRGAILFAGGIFFNKDTTQFTYINLIGKQ